ncbi:putative reverse transcriptase domain-containing protein [Tanacetum coccineum]
MTHPSPKRSMVPKAILMKSDLVSVNTARHVNTAHTKTIVNGASPMSNLSKTAHSTIKRPINKNTTFKNSNQKVDTIRGNNINTARLKAVVNVVKGNHVNDVKALACWVWKPNTKVLDHGNSQVDLQDQGVIYSGCSRHMTGNMSYLTNFKEINGGYVAFGGNPKGGKITSRGKFDGKADEGFFVGYSINSKAFRVFNSRTMIVEENLHVQFSENTPNITGSGPNWLFDIDTLTKLMNYKLVVARNQSNDNAGTKACDDACKARMETMMDPLSSDDEKKVDEDPRKDNECNDQEKEDNVNSTNNVNAASTNKVNDVGTKTSIELSDDPNMPILEDYSIFDLSSDDQDNGAETDMNNLDIIIQVSHIPTTRIHKDHLVEQNIGDLNSAPQTRRMTKNLEEHGSHVDRGYAGRAFTILKLQEGGFFWNSGITNGKRAIGTKWVFKNKKDERGIVIKNKVRLVAQGYTQEEGIDYDEMSSMGELTFFLGLQVKQKKDGIFISQDKYVGEILKKFGFTEVKTASTPMETQKALLKDEDGEEVDVHMYRSMIGSLMYLTSSRPDIMFAVCACARYQVNPKVSHLHAVKRIFSDYARASLDRKSTTGVATAGLLNTTGLKIMLLGINLLLLLKVNAARLKLTTVGEAQMANLKFADTHNMVAFLSKPAESEEFEQIVDFLNSHFIKHALTINPTIFTSCIEQFWATVKVKIVNREVQLQTLVDGKKIIVTEASVRSDLQLDDEEDTDCLPNATIF